MIEQTALVVAVADGAALLEVPRQSGCANCGQVCGTSLIARLFGNQGATRLRVADDLGLAPGEQVVIGIAGPVLLWAALAAWLLPPVVMIISAALGDAAGLGDSGAVLCGGVGLGAGLWLTGLVTGGTGAKARFRPRLLRRAGPGVPVCLAPVHPAVGG